VGGVGEAGWWGGGGVGEGKGVGGGGGWGGGGWGGEGRGEEGGVVEREGMRRTGACLGREKTRDGNRNLELDLRTSCSKTVRRGKAGQEGTNRRPLLPLYLEQTRNV